MRTGWAHRLIRTFRVDRVRRRIESLVSTESSARPDKVGPRYRVRLGRATSPSENGRGQVSSQNVLELVPDGDGARVGVIVRLRHDEKLRAP